MRTNWLKKEACGCCWHVGGSFGFGKKDGSFYMDLFGRTFWPGKLLERIRK